MARRKGLRFYNKPPLLGKEAIKELAVWIYGAALAVLLSLACNYALGMRCTVVGRSMEGYLEAGEEVLVNRISYKLLNPQPGDVVAFLPRGNVNSHYYIKRVVAVPGDRVLVEGGVLYVNGQISAWTSQYIQDGGIALEEILLESGEYFCLGDNINASEDSRSANIGPVGKKDIAGQVWLVLGRGFLPRWIG